MNSKVTHTILKAAALIAILAIFACQKNDLPSDSGCISRITRLNYHVSAADSLSAIQLLKLNNLSTTGFQMEYVQPPDKVTINGVTDIYRYIFGVQLLNGLPVLSLDFGYTFKNNVFQQYTGAHYSGVSLNTQSQLSLPQLRFQYMDQLGSHSSTMAAAFKDSCLTAQFGYYDLNVDDTALVNDHTPNFIKAWSVKPAHSFYPQILFRDDNGAMILYNPGITFDSFAARAYGEKKLHKN